jgi:Mg-chelatase subunit ChlD
MKPIRVLLISFIGAFLLTIGLPKGASLWVKQEVAPSDQRVQLVQTESTDPRPFFRAKLKIVDERGFPISVQLPDDNKLKDAIEIQKFDSSKGKYIGGVIHPFYVYGPKSEAGQTANDRDILLLIDISGSMLRGGKFEAAKNAAKQFVRRTVQDGVDQVCVVPFESHNVAGQFTTSNFVSTKSEAYRAIDNLPQPGDGFNTALYSATKEAVEVLNRRKLDEERKNSSREFVLVVLSDGENDVKNPKDDPGLMDGPKDLETLRNRIEEVGIPVYTIGFGILANDPQRAKKAEDDLKQIAYPTEKNYKRSVDAVRLQESFQVIAQKVLADNIVITFNTDDKQITGLKDFDFKVRLNLPATGGIENPEPFRWVCRGGSGCRPDGLLTTEEKTAWLKRGNAGSAPLPSDSLLWRLFIFGGLAGLLALLWFIPPRLIWPRHRLPQMAGNLRPRVKRQMSQPKNVPPAPDPPYETKVKPAMPPQTSQPRADQPKPNEPPRSKPRQPFEETVIFGKRRGGNNPED